MVLSGGMLPTMRGRCAARKGEARGGQLAVETCVEWRWWDERSSGRADGMKADEHEYILRRGAVEQGELRTNGRAVGEREMVKRNLGEGARPGDHRRLWFESKR